MINRQYRVRQKGFTLFELIIAVMLIFIISTFLVYKYFGLRHAANILVLKGMKLSIQGGAHLTYSASLHNGSQNQLSSVVSLRLLKSLNLSELGLDGEQLKVATRYGYPQANWSEIIKIVELDENRWRYSDLQNGNIKEVVLWTTESGGSIDHCNIRYQGAQQQGYRPKITMNTTGC